MSFPEEKQAIIKILKECDRPCIVELGAQDGEDMEWALQAIADKNPLAIMVEADRFLFEALVKRVPGHLHIYGAIADHDGTCDFWENHAPQTGWGYGSIYSPLPGNSVDYSFFKKTGPIPCFTFDTICEKHNIGRIDLLRVDIHGAEKDMIRHGQEALKRTRHLFIEFFETPTYSGMATRSELLAMLPGWTVIKQFPWNLLLRNDNA